MKNNYEQRGREVVPDVEEKNIILCEKWIVSFSESRRDGSKLSYREFFAQGYYEAYDIVMSYAETQNVHIRWFKEKRNCGSKFLNYNFIKLESFCTYCNKRFNNQDPIPCNHSNCYSSFCSRLCMNDHSMLLHKSNLSNNN
ncbi:MAG: hypothetical protein E6L03_04005 [Thaumarchaeota archaeon]|nr:MAG: hypothetical protein E6L03_04005 [Nitrososphaerota archaeon]